jgi:hypothetical protein
LHRYVGNSPSNANDPQGTDSVGYALLAYLVVPATLIGAVVGYNLDFDCAGVNATGDQIITTLAGAASGFLGSVIAAPFAIAGLVLAPVDAFVINALIAQPAGVAASFFTYRPEIVCDLFNKYKLFQE